MEGTAFRCRDKDAIFVGFEKCGERTASPKRTNFPGRRCVPMHKSAPTSYIVLVVEDDPFVRMAAVDVVIDASCTGLEATNVDEAIAILEAHPEITVLFTDIDMPGSMDGLKLAAAAKARRPELLVIVASGHLKPGAVIPDGVRFFPKPSLPSEIQAALKNKG